MKRTRIKPGKQKLNISHGAILSLLLCVAFVRFAKPFARCKEELNAK